MPIKIKNEGIAISKFPHSICRKDCAINTPTIINAGAVTCEVTTDSNGEKNKPNKKKIPVVIAVIPERPPTAIPADDSTNAPTGEVPNKEPASIAVESEAKAFPTRGILLSFMKPAWFANPTKVPAVSKKVTSKNVSTTTHI